MKALKIVLVAMLFVVGLSASAFADMYGAQLCWNLNDGKSNEVYFLRVGVMDFGGGHYSLAGTKTVTNSAGTTTSATQVVDGNLEYTGANYEISLDVSDAITGSNTMLSEDIHMVLDGTFNGYYFRVGSDRRFTGVAVFTQCP